MSSFYRRALPDPPSTAFSSLRGREIFKRALDRGHMELYFSLSEQFHTQAEPAFCGLASLVMVLNALGHDPGRQWKGVWRWYAEEMLDCCVPLDAIKRTGMNLNQLQCLALCNGAQVTLTRASDTALDDLRDLIKSVSVGTTKHIIVSYTRKLLGQTGDGHFSPIGGYDEVEDLVLIMDVARFKYPPHWVPLKLLFEAMHAIDADSQLERGYLLVESVAERSIHYVISKRNLSWNELYETWNNEGGDRAISSILPSYCDEITTNGGVSDDPELDDLLLNVNTTFDDIIVPSSIKGDQIKITTLILFSLRAIQDIKVLGGWMHPKLRNEVAGLVYQIQTIRNKCDGC